jgi:hypothetical protein
MWAVRICPHRHRPWCCRLARDRGWGEEVGGNSRGPGPSMTGHCATHTPLWGGE